MSKQERRSRRYDGREVIVWKLEFDYPFVDDDIERWKYDLVLDKINDGLYLMEVFLNGVTFEIYCAYDFDEDKYTIISVEQRDKSIN